MTNSIAMAAPEMPPIPMVLVDKANDLYTYLMNTQTPLGEQLSAVYRYIDEFSTYLAPLMSCEKGCSHCCRIDVQLTTLEAEYIQVHTGIPLRASGQLTTGHRDACPFLVNGGACGIYPVRPLICRLYHAAGRPENCKVGRLQFHYGHPPQYGNDIFANLVKWVHHITIDGGGSLRDVRDFFPTKKYAP